MARESGSFREDYIATIAALETALVGYATVVDARLTASSGADADALIANVSITMTAENGSSAIYAHKCSFTIDTGVVADALGNFTALVAALEIYLNAMLTASDYDDVNSLKKISISASISGSN